MLKSLGTRAPLNTAVKFFIFASFVATPIALAKAPTSGTNKISQCARYLMSNIEDTLDRIRSPKSLLNKLNTTFETLHGTKERAFWQFRMGHSAYVEGSVESAQKEVTDFMSDRRYMPLIEAKLARKNLDPSVKLGLEGWLHFFRVNTVAPATIDKINRLTDLEGALNTKKKAIPLTVYDPTTNKLVEATLIKVGMVLANDSNERVRKSAYDSLRFLEEEILKSGFIEVVKMRREIAKSDGLNDFYDWKVRRIDGMTKQELFQRLDALELQTRDSARVSQDALAREKGEAVLKAWNYGYMTAGSSREKMDPYMQFEDSLGRWARMFAGMGIKYNKATLQVDLVDRKNKYPNGFMHGPVPGYIHTDGQYYPASINFTANADPALSGAGEKALVTFIHEGGHAAHFSNILMPAASHAQEFAPSSVAAAETQSMFLDSLVYSPEWLARFARNKDGQPMPVSLIMEYALESQKLKARRLRQLMVVPYFEKALYEMSDEELTPENILRVARQVEQRLLLTDSPRPVLSVPHLLSDVSSAYYHGYILAEMAVYQTTDYFTKKYGYIIDNASVGADLKQHYWNPGNSKSFLELVKGMTGDDFSATATIASINLTQEQVRQNVQAALKRESTIIPRYTGPLDLDAQIYIVHGDETITSNANGRTVESMIPEFRAWIEKLKAQPE